MNKEEFLQGLKDPNIFEAADKLITRTKSQIEIEDLTLFPVPAHDRRDHLDRYNLDVLNDKEIERRKTEIGRKNMQVAWAEDMQTADGWKDFANRLPDANIIGLYNGRKYGISVENGVIVLLTDTDRQMTASEIAVAVSDTVKYTLRKKTLRLNKVLIFSPDEVVLSLM